MAPVSGLVKSICRLNLGEMSQSTGDTLLPQLCETNFCHIGILFLDSILSFRRCRHVILHRLTSESDHLWRCYDVMAIFKMAAVAVSHVGFAQRYCRPPVKCN